MCSLFFMVTAVLTCKICAKVETTTLYRSRFDSCFYRTNAHRCHEFHSQYQEQSGALKRQWSANWSAVTSVHMKCGVLLNYCSQKSNGCTSSCSPQQRQELLTSTGPCIQAVSLTSQQVLQRLRSWCLLATLPQILQAKTNSWFNYKSLSWGITDE